MQRWSIIPIEQKVFSITREIRHFEKEYIDHNVAKILSYNLSLSIPIDRLKIWYSEFSTKSHFLERVLMERVQ